MEPPEKLFFVFQLIPSTPISSSVFIALAAMGILLFTAILLSLAETALFSLSPAEQKQLIEEDNTPAQRVIKLLENPKKLLATLLVGHGITTTGLVIILGYLLENSVSASLDKTWMIYLSQAAILVFLIVVVANIIPKIYASNKAYQLSKNLSATLLLLQGILAPLGNFLHKSTAWIDDNKTKKGNGLSVDELEHALELSYQNKETSTEEQKILKGIVKFGNTEVVQIMTSRMDIISVDYDDNFEEVLAVVQESGYSRIPVFKDQREKVCGILYIKDLLVHLDEPNTQWQNLIRPTYFVPENKKIVDLLEDFQKKKMHLAIVVDEYGSNRGLITLEDIIEEIVGEIEDEFDDKDLLYSKLDENNYIFEGKTPLIDLYKVLGIDGEQFEAARGESGSIAGFMLEQSGRILKKHEKINFEKYTFTVEAADRRRVKRIKLSINPQ